MTSTVDFVPAMKDLQVRPVKYYPIHILLDLIPFQLCSCKSINEIMSLLLYK